MRVICLTFSYGADPEQSPLFATEIWSTSSSLWKSRTTHLELHPVWQVTGNTLGMLGIRYLSVIGPLSLVYKDTIEIFDNSSGNALGNVGNCSW